MNVAQTQYPSNSISKIKYSLQAWVRRMIIDFDPCDQGALEAQILLKDWDLFQEGTDNF